MGGGKEKKKTNKMISDQQQQVSQEHQEYKAKEQEGGWDVEPRRAEAREKMLTSLDYQPQAYTPERVQAARVDAPSGYGDMARTGGIDADAMRRGSDKFGGGGVFEEYSKTGGLDEGARANIRSRGTSVIPAFYSRLKEEGNRQAAVQGGYGPGRMSMMARLARQQAQGAQHAALEAETDITDRVNQGRMWGAEGVQRHGQMENAMEQQIGAAQQRGRMFGVEGQGRYALANQAAENQANMFNAGNANAAMSEFGGRQDEMAARRSGQLQSLYGMETDESLNRLQAGTSERGLTYGSQGNLIDQRMRNNPQRDWLGTAIGIGGMAGGVMTGMGGMGFGRRRAA